MKRKTPYVLIEVVGGVAYVVEKTKGVGVELRDYDNYPVVEDAAAHADIYHAKDEVKRGK